ncbi:MAG: serine/threonine protein kinase [bacterium]|nr:serine/threonine protein kinase [bacterium]
MKELPRIPGYKIVETIGRGGMADVYLGVQENLDRKVAVKVLAPVLFRDEQFPVRFLKEARTAAQLSHPNIITIHDVGRIDETYYMVMEYLAESLKDVIKRQGVINPGKAFSIIGQIASALAYAHGRGFIHRDVKSDNIMFRRDGTVVLVDFGIARAIESNTNLTGTGAGIGTPHYMSPEQCRGEKIDGRSDIYSLGVLLYELLTGTVPYNAENTTGIILKHIQADIPALPPHLKKYQPMIDRMMAKERNERAESAAELLSLVSTVESADEFMPTIPITQPETAFPRAETTVTDRQETLPKTHVRRPNAPHKKMLPALLVIAAIILVAITIYFFPGKNGTENADISNQQETAGQAASKYTIKINGQQEQNKPSPVQAGTHPADIAGTKNEKQAEPSKKVLPGNRDQPKVAYKKKETTDPPPSDRVADIVAFRELTPDLIAEYESKLQHLTIQLRAGRKQLLKRMKRRIHVSGSLTVGIIVEANGSIVCRLLGDHLQGMNPAQRIRIAKAVIKKIGNIALSPPKTPDNRSVKVTRWEISYQAKLLNGQISFTGTL